MTSIDVPGKVLLLGEYSVLVGGPALLASLPVRFLYRTGGKASERLRIHSAAPAARIVGRVPLPGFLEQHPSGGVELTLDLLRTVEGASAAGLGSSTADFIAVHALADPSADWSVAWREYRELHRSDPVPPSGADLAAQWNGGIGVFRLQPASGTADWTPVRRDLGGAPIILLQASHQAGRKTATHAHLSRMVARLDEFRELSPIARAGVAAFERADWPEFAARVREFSAWLSDRGFEHPWTAEDRKAIEALPGVLAVKGCGAMLSDSLLIVTDGQASTESTVRGLAAARDLRVLQSGLPTVPGLEIRH